MCIIGCNLLKFSVLWAVMHIMINVEYFILELNVESELTDLVWAKKVVNWQNEKEK